MRDLRLLPKANLHLHLTGSMRPATLAELADRYGVPLPPPLAPGVAHGWAAFQTGYDAARAALRSAEDIARVVAEAAAADAADGGGWLELQVDPTSYAARLGGLELVVEAVLAGARAGSVRSEERSDEDGRGRQPGPRASGASADQQSAGSGTTGVVLAASWARPPEQAIRVARLAVRYAGAGVVGFGLSDDERRGRVADFAPAFRIASEAGLLAVPHAGFYEPAWHVRDCVTLLGAGRIGHGVSACTDPATLDLLATRGVALEVCPTSYPPLGVIADFAALPLRTLLDAGVRVALGSDDPLLFPGGLHRQYEIARHALGCTDAELAMLARHSVESSAAPVEVRRRLAAGIDAWAAGV